MRRIFTVLCVLVAASAANAQELWLGKDGNIRNVDTRDMVMARGALYLATRDEVYTAPDPKARWESIFALPVGENEITSVSVIQGCIFVGTRRGLYRSADSGKTWKNVFRTIIPEKNNINAIESDRVSQKAVVICTAKGIFKSFDLGNGWEDISGNIRNKSVLCAALNKDDIYAGAEDGLYLRKAGSAGWERISVTSSNQTPAESVSSGEDPAAWEEAPSSTGVSCIAFKGGRLYASSPDKIIYSDDGGSAWTSMPSLGLSGAINHIAISDKTDKIYCATSKGVFTFDKDARVWSELYRGMDKAYNVRKVLLDGEDQRSMWALTPSGLYKYESAQLLQDKFADVERGLKSFRIICDSEPLFRELQRAAMRFADVEPEKITRWHAESRLKALVPKISFGYDADRSTNNEIYTSATREYIFVGPDDISNGFDVSVSWDLGNLIWSDDQTNIDVRSRLTTQLRNDVLDDLRRAYFERKRLQFELAQSPPKELKARFDKELRIQELTQAIDDLTGNYLSEHTRKTDEKMGTVPKEPI